MGTELTEEDRERLRQLEEELWREETRFDAAYMERVLADDLIEFGRSGRVYQRSDGLAVSRQPIQAVIPLPELTIRPLSANIALVTYNSHVTYDGVVQKAHRSSIWSRTSDGWVLRFHQGTPYEDARKQPKSK